MKQLAVSFFHSIRSALGLVALCIVCGVSNAETVFQVSVGSYTQLENARQALEKANSELGAGHQVFRAETQQGDVYRVLSRPYASKQDAQRAVAAARRNNISGAWIVSSQRVQTAPQDVRTTSPQVADNTPVQQPTSRTAPSNRVALNGSQGVPVTLSENTASTTTSSNAISIQKTTEADAAITVDGKLSESIWSSLPNTGKFVVLEPDTLADVPHASHIKFAYTDEGLYIGADLEQPKDTLIKRLSGRDVYAGLNRDSINLTLDTSGEGLYGFWFGINLGDSLMDGTVLPEYRFSNEWDGPWRGASVETDTGWSAEFSFHGALSPCPVAETSATWACTCPARWRISTSAGAGRLCPALDQSSYPFCNRSS